MDFERVNCNLCNSDNHKYLFQKEARGFKFRVVKCKNCGFVFMNPMITEKKLDELYSTYHNTFDLHKVELFYLHDTSLFEKILKQIKLSEGNLLDIGCSMDFFLNAVKKAYPNWNVFGCDVSKKAIEFGRKTHKLNLKLGKFEDCNYPSNFFDLVTLQEVIEHVRKPVDVLKKVNRILKMERYVFIQTGNMDSLISMVLGKNHTYYNIYHLNYFSLKTIKIALEKAGFQIVKVGGIHFLEEDLLNKFGFNIKIWLKLLGFKFLNKLRVGNFSIMGGMCVFAQKIANVD